VPTCASENNKTYQWDIVIKCNRLLTRAAVGYRENNGLVKGKAMNTNIEETPQNYSENKRKDKYHDLSLE
jgi:hypothetical protein